MSNNEMPPDEMHPLYPEHPLKPKDEGSPAPSCSAFPDLRVGDTFWAGSELFFKFSRTEAVRYEDAYTYDPTDGKLKQNANREAPPRHENSTKGKSE